MMSRMPLETCWAFNEGWNNKFYYKVASCWLFFLSHTAMHGSTNIKKKKWKRCFVLGPWPPQKTNMKRVFTVTVHKLCIILFFVDVCFLLVLLNYCRHVQIVVQVCSLWWMQYEVAWGRTWAFWDQFSRQHYERAFRALVLCCDWDVVQRNMHLIVSIRG
jgi:hypothetical protein